MSRALTDVTEAVQAARQAAYRAVGLQGHEVACLRYDNALMAALGSLVQQGYRILPPEPVPTPCTCKDSVRSRVGTCPLPGDREHGRCTRQRVQL